MTRSAGQRARQPAREAPGSGYGSYLIATSDSALLDPPVRSLYVTVGGDVRFVGDDGETDTWTVPDNSVIPIRCKQVLTTGTTATGIHGIV